MFRMSVGEESDIWALILGWGNRQVNEAGITHRLTTRWYVAELGRAALILLHLRGGEFVVSTAGEAYDARIRTQDW